MTPFYAILWFWQLCEPLNLISYKLWKLDVSGFVGVLLTDKYITIKQCPTDISLNTLFYLSMYIARKIRQKWFQKFSDLTPYKN